MAGKQAARWCVVSCVVVLAGCGGPDGEAADEIAAGVGEVTVEARSGDPAAAGERPAGIVVDVAGAVRRPGVYRLAKGSRVHEAIAAAGGVTARGDTTTLNRAAEAVDGAQITVPVRGAASSAPGVPAGLTASGAGAGAASGAKVSINAADVAALDTLPGIGPVTAQQIVDDRAANGPFTSVDDLDRVPGIGRATVQQLEAVVTL